MCISSLLGQQQPSIPPPPPPPPAPPPPPTEADPAVKDAQKRNRQLAALAEGRSSTILTSGLGLTSPARTAGKTLLGA